MMPRTALWVALTLATFVAHAEVTREAQGERAAEVERLKAREDELKQDVTRLEAELATARAAHNATSDASSPPGPNHETVFLREPERQSSTSWPVLVGSAAVMLLVGFIAGWTTLDRRIRQKYGGLKIH